MPSVIVDLEGKQKRVKELRWAYAGKVIVHYKRGDTYVIETFACRETDGEIMMIYRSAGWEHYWVRPWAECEEQVGEGKRFMLVNP